MEEDVEEVDELKMEEDEDPLLLSGKKVAFLVVSKMLIHTLKIMLTLINYIF